ncbi:MAG: hypothetical protein U1D25_13710 [Hydrogenophaga sp.]|uniref:hypothetical protein n=1 Tax=Hydrogenophaga sp. TaxID=1904254 RepID=UPI002AB9E9CF|nr:hypothetical protein [Hydrogenophaga sp.]MDZ4189148.1 hypothetical protein [Hydrogenophaga sp.]
MVPPVPVYPLPVYPQQPPLEEWPLVVPGAEVPVVVIVPMPPELLTLVPPVPVVPAPTEKQPSVIVPIKVPPKIHITPPRPPKQDRN